MKTSKANDIIFTRMIQLGDPGPVMEVTQDVRILLGDRLATGDQEASTSARVLLQCPAIGTVVSVLLQVRHYM